MRGFAPNIPDMAHGLKFQSLVNITAFTTSVRKAFACVFVLMSCIFAFCVPSPALSSEASGQSGYTPPPMFGEAPVSSPEARQDPKREKKKPTGHKSGSNLLTFPADEAQPSRNTTVQAPEDIPPLPPRKNSQEMPGILAINIPKPPEKPEAARPMAGQDITSGRQLRQHANTNIVKPGKKPDEIKAARTMMPAVRPEPVQQMILSPPTKQNTQREISNISAGSMPYFGGQANDISLINKAQELPPQAAARVEESTGKHKPLPDKQDRQVDTVLNFASGQTKMNADMKDQMYEHIIPAIKNAAGARIKIEAYATPYGQGQSRARRISLARALDVRLFLLENAIHPDKIDIRALGEGETNVRTANAGESFSKDRVELTIVTP